MNSSNQRFQGGREWKDSLIWDVNIAIIKKKSNKKRENMWPAGV